MPDDPWFDELDPILKLYMYNSWICDLEEKHKFEKDYTIFLGQFINPQLAQKYYDNDNNINISTTNEEFEQSLEMMKLEREKWLKEKNKYAKNQNARRRRRQLIRE